MTGYLFKLTSIIIFLLSFLVGEAMAQGSVRPLDRILTSATIKKKDGEVKLKKEGSKGIIEPKIEDTFEPQAHLQTGDTPSQATLFFNDDYTKEDYTTNYTTKGTLFENSSFNFKRQQTAATIGRCVKGEMIFQQQFPSSSSYKENSPYLELEAGEMLITNAPHGVATVIGTSCGCVRSPKSDDPEASTSALEYAKGVRKRIARKRVARKIY